MIDFLLKRPRSFCRFGDSELEAMLGNDMIFQHGDARLAKILQEALRSNDDGCAVGLSNYYREVSDNSVDFSGRFYYVTSRRYRCIIDQYANHGRSYISPGFTCPYISQKDIDSIHMAKRYEKILRLFEQRNLVVFAGDRVFSKLKYNVFERAKSLQIVQCPTENAFDRYDDILNMAREYPKEEATLCFILGPTATAAAYELSKEGYLAWDIGHIAKDYDAYRKQTPRTSETCFTFYQRD